MKPTASALRTGGCMLIALLSIVGVEQAGGASIGLFSTPDCSSCNLAVSPGETGRFYVRALTEGIPPEWGFTGAGLRITGLPAGWLAVSLPNPEATLSVGDPFGPNGARMGFSSNIPGTCIDLYTVSVTATSLFTEGRLHVEGVQSTWNPTVICPLFVPGCLLCDFDVCVDGGTLFINSAIECSVSIEKTGWTQIKSLYR